MSPLWQFAKQFECSTLVSLPTVIGESTVKGIAYYYDHTHIFFPTVPVLGLETVYSRPRYVRV